MSCLLEENFCMFAGEKKTIRVTVTDLTGGYKDLTSATIKWALQKIGTTVLEKTTPTEITILLPPTLGIFDINLLAIDTEGLGTGIYKHQAQVTDDTGVTEVVFEGNVTLYNSLFD